MAYAQQEDIIINANSPQRPLNPELFATQQYSSRPDSVWFAHLWAPMKRRVIDINAAYLWRYCAVYFSRCRKDALSSFTTSFRSTISDLLDDHNLFFRFRGWRFHVGSQKPIPWELIIEWIRQRTISKEWLWKVCFNSVCLMVHIMINRIVIEQELKRVPREIPSTMIVHYHQHLFWRTPLPVFIVAKTKKNIASRRERQASFIAMAVPTVSRINPSRGWLYSAPKA